MSALDPDLAAYFASLGTLFPPLPADRRRWSAAPATGRWWALAHAAAVERDDERRAARPRLRAVGVRLFYGHDGADEPVPTIIYFHGGGWVVGDTDTHTVTCARLAHEANALVVSVDYPLAPGRTGAPSPMPASKRLRHRRRIVSRGTPAPIAVAGDSAGPSRGPSPRCARATKAISSHCRRRSTRPSPGLRHTELQRFAAGPGLTRADMQWYWRHFVGDDHGFGRHRVAPTRAASHAGLPPAYVVTAGATRCATKAASYAATARLPASTWRMTSSIRCRTAFYAWRSTAPRPMPRSPA